MDPCLFVDKDKLISQLTSDSNALFFKIEYMRELIASDDANGFFTHVPPNQIAIYRPLQFNYAIQNCKGLREYLAQWLRTGSHPFLVSLCPTVANSKLEGLGFAFWRADGDEPEYAWESRRVSYMMNGGIVQSSDGSWSAHS